MTGFLQDHRFAVRQLRKTPGFAAVAIFTLALGISASSIIFSVIYNGVLHPFPYRSADRLMAIGVQDVEHPDNVKDAYRLDQVAMLRKENHSFEDILGYAAYPALVYTRQNSSEMLQGVGATPNAMGFWGVAPLLGRGFGEEDARADAAPVVLLSYQFWQREFQGNPHALGRVVTLNGEARTVIGVMPPRFQPVGGEVYLPISWSRAEPRPDEPAYFWATGILKEGVGFKAAAADMRGIVGALSVTRPDDFPKKFRVTFQKLNEVVLGGFQETMLLLFGAVGLVLFISCSNVAGLLLARASARTKEISIRAALGASRRRLMTQWLYESLLLAVAGCVLGCVLAELGLKALLAIQLAPLPGESDVRLNLPVLVFAVSISLLSAVFCGFAPALHSIKRDLQRGLANVGPNIDSRFQHSRLRSGLVVGQVALSVLLLSSAGLITRSFLTIKGNTLSIEPERFFVAQLHFPHGRYTKAEEKTAFLQRLLPRLNSLPRSSHATVMLGIPLIYSSRADISIAGKLHRETWHADVELCSETYPQTLNVPMLQGRFFNGSDLASARHVAVVNESLVRRYFPGESAIGREIEVDDMDELPKTLRNVPFLIVGVVSNAAGYNFDEEAVTPLPQKKARAAVFLPYSVSGLGDRTIALQSKVPPASLVNSIRQVIWSIDHDVVLFQPNINGAVGYSLDELLEGLVYGRQEFAAVSFGACSALGFALAVIGLFSVMTYLVSLRRHEIGVRLALGAQAGNIIGMVLKHGMMLLVIGSVSGLLVSVGLTRWAASQFYGISATDPLTLILVNALVIGTGICACLLPARRATQVDPLKTLRAE